MNAMPELIVVRKQSLLHESSRIVQILFTRSKTGEIQEPDPRLFQTKTVWISTGYEKIEESFDEGELFLIEQYQETDKDSYSYDSTTLPSRSEYWAKGTAAKRLDPSQCIPVIRAELPDKGTGILSYGNNLPQGQFFILNEGDLYGPFTATQADDDIYAATVQSLPLGLSIGDIAKLPAKKLKQAGVFLQVSADEFATEIGYITSLKDIVAVMSARDIEKIDYINDTQLINYFARSKFGLRGKPALARKPAEELKAAVSLMTKQHQVASANERVERLLTILDQYLEQPELGRDIIHDWLSTSAGKTYLHELATDKPQLFENPSKETNTQRGSLEADLERLRAEKRKLESAILAEKSRVQKARTEADKAIEDLNKRTAQQQQAGRQQVMADLEVKIQDAETALSDKKNELDSLLNNVDHAATLQDLTKEIEYQERRKEELRGAVKAQERLLKSPELSDEAIKTQTLLDLIHGRSLSRSDAQSTYTAPKLAQSQPSDGHTVIQAMVEHFDDGGRSFTFEETANLLVTVQQSFMTVLKGLPGAGKTSTAIRLAQAYHIANQNGQGDDFLNVPISRGWVSGRDFIGFYNSLKGCYQPARTGMYQFLNNGAQPEARNSLRLVLLDEANLSPMEHYLSDFLGMFDAEGRNRPIDTGNPAQEQRFLHVPLNTRFIATINNDNTTEPLSPRLCDRVPIISMDLQEPNSTQHHTAFTLDGVIPYDILEGFFGVPNAAQQDDAELPLPLIHMLNLFEERNRELGPMTVISKRKRMAMQVYFSVAQRFMDESKATDFALSQYVLPLVNGFGQPYKKRLERVAECAQKNHLSRSVTILDDIIHSGDAHIGSYNFF